MQKSFSFYLKKVLSFFLLAVVIISATLFLLHASSGSGILHNLLWGEHALILWLVFPTGSLIWGCLTVLMMVYQFFNRRHHTKIVQPSSLSQSVFLNNFYKYFYLVAMILSLLSLFMVHCGLLTFILALIFYHYRRNHPAFMVHLMAISFWVYWFITRTADSWSGMGVIVAFFFGVKIILPFTTILAVIATTYQKMRMRKNNSSIRVKLN